MTSWALPIHAYFDSTLKAHRRKPGKFVYAGENRI
ncbi:hypothetical protein BV360_02969 [Pseudomonas syringae pv. actinidiae]|nr:hypothetical protein BV340_02822 [Pseudomonas syringae pv. actinidiae]OSN18856.1 hypothetical protein BV339_02973 [Pseudomonas syringae pv. actinidiae]OSN26090.1 hypothetical protein BV341_02852 [Pseudomonas syringae pv. actinidiae]OSN33881.1 hypothetical protein BV343_02897 [Pseudomonas syringae pv. actinidiae]OSN42923.1 hypothetical protein BV344_02899 [Pseudomonas syringae pv. actinidiae]